MWAKSICRACPNNCPVEVDVEEGVLVQVRAIPDDPFYEGFSCARGLNQPAYYNHPDRLLQPQKRQSDGTYKAISTEQAMDEVAAKLLAIRDAHGPRSIAGYWGMMVCANLLSIPMMSAFMKAVDSPMYFTASAIDKPGRDIAQALHGTWMAPRRCYDRPDAVLLVGLNPLISFQGVPTGHPAHWLRDSLARGMDLVVIDPRRTETARRATLHLQARPGHDAALLASIIRTILAEGLGDPEFVAENATGLPSLRDAVEPFAPGPVATAAGVDAADIVKAARIFGSAERAVAVSGTGPSMSGASTLVEYLVLCLETLCGNWLRAGETIANPGVLIPTRSAIAQAAPPRPAYGFGEKIRVRGLANTAAGMPTAALSEEILLEGEGQVRALLSCGGNPASSWPDAHRARHALKSLDLLVQIDPWFSETAQLADYVIAPPMAYETPASSVGRELAGIIAEPAVSWQHPLGAWYPKVVDPPVGSDLIEEWRFLLGVAHRMGLDPVFTPMGGPAHAKTLARGGPVPTADEMLELFSAGSRIPVATVRAEGEKVYTDPPLVVREKEPGWTGRLDLANDDMLADLKAVSALDESASTPRFSLICRRTAQGFNSSFHPSSINKGRPDNPAFLHPVDLAELGLHKEARVLLRSSVGSIEVSVLPDAALRRGIVSLTHGYGLRAVDGTVHGSNVNDLLSADARYEKYSGLPLMSNVSVEVIAL